MRIPEASRKLDWREAGTFLLLAFAVSWILWAAGIRAKVREEILLCGTAGPAFAAAVMRVWRPDPHAARFRFPLAVFVCLVPVSWVALVLAAAARDGYRAIEWEPLLILPALMPPLSVAFFLGAGELRWTGWRWPVIAALSLAAFLLVPAALARLAGLPIVDPRRGESLPLTIAAAGAMFSKQLLFAGMLEEPGWRGWLLPRFERRFSPLLASLLVWLPWALWHAPLDFTGGVGQNLLNYLQIRVVFFIAISILLTWFYNRSWRSIPVAALFHAGFNTFPFVLPYSPPLLGLIFVWMIAVVVADRMWRRPTGPRTPR